MSSDVSPGTVLSLVLFLRKVCSEQPIPRSSCRESVLNCTRAVVCLYHFQIFLEFYFTRFACHRPSSPHTLHLSSFFFAFGSSNPPKNLSFVRTRKERGGCFLRCQFSKIHDTSRGCPTQGSLSYVLLISFPFINRGSHDDNDSHFLVAVAEKKRKKTYN